MIKANFILYAFLAMFVGVKSSSATGLDQIYRDLVRSDNRGYLPLFVKNRNTPEVGSSDKLLEEVAAPVEVEKDNTVGLEDVNLDNPRQKKNMELEAENERWQQVLANVQRGYVSSYEIGILNSYEADDNPQAVEVLGWMYSQGVGVDQDLIRSFNYYKKAVDLGVSSAMENAVKVYRAMSASQKEKLLKMHE